MLNEGQDKAVDILTNWYRGTEKMAVIEGYAGTGKTFVSKYVIEALGLRNVLVSAPTNQAVGVISEASGFKGKTLHSILGLRMDVDLADFNPNNPQFNALGDYDVSYDLIVVDEASMINKHLYKELVDVVKKNRVKILFMGDRYQLPPVGEPMSKIFTDIKIRAVLDKVVRQGEDNPNGKLIQLAVDDVNNGTSKVDDFIRSNQCLDITPDNLYKSKGFVFLWDNKYGAADFFNADAENLLLTDSRYIAWTNKNVEAIMRMLRDKTFGMKQYITSGDSLTGYRTISVGRSNSKNPLINSRSYTIDEVKPVTLELNMQGFRLLIRDVFDKHCNYINIVNLSDTETRSIYQSKVYELYTTAYSLGGRAWRAYYNFIDNNLSMETLYKPSGSKLKNKDVDFSYGITTHKAQGSTFINSFINITNLNRCYDIKDRTRLKYVAISRCKNVNIFM